jgi:hypothetical protein
MRRLTWTIAAISAATSTATIAVPITGAGSLVGANPINLPASNLTGTGPVVIGGGVTWSSNQSTSLYGWTGGYTTGNATIAAGSPPIIAVNAAYDVVSSGYATMTLSFATPTSGFLAELFWTDNEATNLNSASIYIYDAANNLLEFTGLNNNGNSIGLQSGYYGFSRATADISYVKFSNSHIGARNLSYIGPAINALTGAVPEPGTWAMMLLGFAGIGIAMRRQRKPLSIKPA